MHLSSIILENFKDRALIILEILEFIELHTYKFGLVHYHCFTLDLSFQENSLSFFPRAALRWLLNAFEQIAIECRDVN